MLEIIEKHKQELIIGLADLYIRKERIEEQIKAQRAAIEQCSALQKAGEKPETPEV